MNSRIFARLSIQSALLITLVSCSDATQFAEQTLPNDLNAQVPATSEVPSENVTVANPGDGTNPNGEIINEDNPTGVSPEGSNPSDGNGSNPVANTGTGTGGAGTGTGTGGTGTGGIVNGPAAPGEVFSECSSNPDMAIVSQLYQLPPQTDHLPDFSTMRSVGDVCVSQLNIADRDFTQGFPGVSEIFEWFALDMRFKLKITTPGEYKFFLNSDDGSILSINNSVVINNDGTHSQLEKTGSKYLAAGVHDVQVRYYQGPRTRIALELFWKLPGSTAKVYVPKSVMMRP